MKYVGVDLHKKSISVCVMSEARRVLQTRRFVCVEPHRIEAFFRELGPHEVVVEATVGYEWLLRLVEPYAHRAVLAHPGKLRVIAESTRKSDKLDARVLAEFLALGMIPEAHRPTPRVRDHRALVRHRQFVQQRITATKSKIRRVLWDYNADLARPLHAARPRTVWIRPRSPRRTVLRWSSSRPNSRSCKIACKKPTTNSGASPARGPRPSKKPGGCSARSRAWVR